MTFADRLKELREKHGKRPCDCESCDCQNSGDTYSVGGWDGAEWVLKELRVAEIEALVRAIDEFIAALDNSVSPEDGDDIAAMLRYGKADKALRLARAALEKP
jgi:hypothetical protein